MGPKFKFCSCAYIEKQFVHINMMDIKDSFSRGVWIVLFVIFWNTALNNHSEMINFFI